ncbi:hypothetical protein A2966_01390 [Candidatus Roizmanbacteria bacterium RIFCSPLOWO2_01_FULL_41_22]|uniref:PIN domain-containing protein n=2 Tax=Candidatus Roizmaniibacteriota TaxID=1752723 RepID=A0A1F7JR55_9BACT|nr:MAG: hypothetical protein A2966_01390 [Candidatus Roizmanbacteria bacterium RIFCSPLOWO2_01_FULL_41_22]OGK58092.1 MAG: hypothetical protein A3H86_01180 [Candidatus Roizmanbacteria bacterium RIFCSPLOWO2_02_FULL_41_9]
MKVYVLDTSVVIKWYNRKAEKHVNQALSILNDLKENKINIVIPSLLIVELVNVFIKGKQLKASVIQDLTTSFFSLPLIMKEPTSELISQIPAISHQYKLTAYDSLYIAQALNENCQLISGDAQGHGKVTDGTVLMLKDY